MTQPSLSAGIPASSPARPGADGRVLVLVLNYNGLLDTLACLDSLRGQSHPSIHVLVVDNGSASADAAAIARAFPEVDVVALPENLGWAGGNNVGMRLALDRGYSHICLLNNDTVLEPTAIEAMLAAARLLGPRCLVHPAIAYFDAPSTWQLRPEPGNPRDDLAALALQYDIVEMAYAYGACLLIPAEVVRDVGLFDERFFLQLEEADYFERASARGVRSFCARRACIRHKESASFGRRITPDKTYYMVRNSCLLAEKRQGSLFALLAGMRRLTWSLQTQARATGADFVGWLGFLAWLASGHPLAGAARQGVVDYACRRFGRRRVRGRASP